MDISVLDASNYFRGLLLLIRQDRVVREPEMRLMRRVGKALGFESTFCENAIHEILDNQYISSEPPVFSSRELAEKFLIDGWRIAHADEDAHELEEKWLRSAAGANGFADEEFLNLKKLALPRKGEEISLEVDRLKVLHGG